MLTNEFKNFVNDLITKIIKNRRIYKRYTNDDINDQNKLKPPYKCLGIEYFYNLDKVFCDINYLFKMDSYENYYYDNVKNNDIYGNESFIISDNYGSCDDGYYNSWLQFNLVFVFLNKIVIVTYLTNNDIEYTIIPFLKVVDKENNFQNFFKFFGDKRGYKIEYADHKDKMESIQFRINNYNDYSEDIHRIYNILKQCCKKNNLLNQFMEAPTYQWIIPLEKNNATSFKTKFDTKELAELYYKEKLVKKYVQHINNKKWYKTLDLCKIQVNSEWVDGIIYVASNDVDEEKQKFVRTVDEFLLKFY